MKWNMIYSDKLITTKKNYKKLQMSFSLILQANRKKTLKSKSRFGTTYLQYVLQCYAINKNKQIVIFFKIL